MAAVDASLFGVLDAVRSAAQTKRNGPGNGQIRITKEKLATLRAPTAIASAEEIGQAKAAKLDEAAHRLVDARRRLASKSLAQRTVVPPMTQLHEKRKQERDAIIARAENKKLEEREEVRQMNQMVNACLTMASLDAQVREARRAAERAAQQRALDDTRMAEAWHHEATAAEEAERQRWLQYRAGEAMILEQLEERARQAEAAKKATQEEGAARRAAAERAAIEAEEAEHKRRAAGAALLEEIAAFNATRLGRQVAALQAQREEDAAISRFLAEKDAKEQAAAEAREAEKKAAELRLARQWAEAHKAEAAVDQALEDWIQYLQDAKEAADVAKEQEQEAARRQACRDQQQAMQQHRDWKIAAQHSKQVEDRKEVEKAAAAAAAARQDAEREEMTKAAATHALHQALTAQMRQKEANEIEARAVAAQAAQDAAAALERDRAKLQRVKEEKLKLIAGAPPQYRADLKRFTIA